MAAGALGIKVRVAGRLNGGEIARSEVQRRGRVPLHTFSADIDYAIVEAATTAGTIGIKVWIFRKLLFKKTTKELLAEAKENEPVVLSTEPKETPTLGSATAIVGLAPALKPAADSGSTEIPKEEKSDVDA